MPHQMDIDSSLREYLEQAILADGKKPCLVHGGHFFLIHHDTFTNIDGMPDVEYEFVNRSRAFTRYTWHLACQIARNCNRKDRGVMLAVLVNDWQFIHINGTQTKRGHRHRIADKIREAFYDRVPTIPETHTRIMRDYNLDDETLIRFEAERWLFSEVELRRRLGKSLEALFASGDAEKLGLSKKQTESGPIIDLKTDQAQPTTLMHCGSSNCAGEVVELLREIYDRGFRFFVNLYPQECDAPVSSGTQMAQRIFRLKELTVLNVAIPNVNLRTLGRSQALVDLIQF